MYFGTCTKHFWEGHVTVSKVNRDSRTFDFMHDNKLRSIHLDQVHTDSAIGVGLDDKGKARWPQVGEKGLLVMSAHVAANQGLLN